jgi:hypothetical protein
MPTDGRDEANSRFSQFFEHPSKRRNIRISALNSVLLTGASAVGEMGVCQDLCRAVRRDSNSDHVVRPVSLLVQAFASHTEVMRNVQTATGM